MRPAAAAQLEWLSLTSTPAARYNVREETFVTETEAAATEYKDPVSGAPLEKMLEASYFFKQSKCASALRTAARNLQLTARGAQVPRAADTVHSGAS